MKTIALVLPFLLSASVSLANTDRVFCAIGSASSSGKILNSLKGYSTPDNAISFSDIDPYMVKFVGATGQVLKKSPSAYVVTLNIQTAANDKFSLEEVVIAPTQEFKATLKTSFGKVSVLCGIEK